MPIELLLAQLLLFPAQVSAVELPNPWMVETSAGRRNFAEGKYAEAVASYRAALAKAEESKAETAAIAPLLQPLAAALKVGGDPAEAQRVLERLLPLVAELHGAQGHPYADVLVEIANVQRMQDLRKEASETITKVVQIRSALGLSEALAKDATLAGAIFQEMGDSEGAKNYYTQALAFWGALPTSGLQVLTVLDPLVAIYRDESAYRDTEIYCLWALRLREATLGPKHSELIATLDSLAYALFGQKKYEEAEPVYLRLLAIWEGSAGAEHPMVALTLDKMVEFYSAQKLYDKAAPLSQRSQAMRTKAVLESFHRTGRVLIGEQKLPEAIDLYQRAIKIGENAKVPDESMEGLLRTYALVLAHSGRKEESAAVEKRLKDAIIGKADREGTRRPQPKPISPK